MSTNITDIRPAICCGMEIDTLLWDQDGYWAARGNAPDWFTPEVIAIAKTHAAQARPAALRSEIIPGNKPSSGYLCTYRIIDDNNPWMKPWEVGLEAKSEQAAKTYVANRLAEMSQLHAGTMEALMFYARTGEARLQRWRPENQKFGYRTTNGKEQRVQLYKRIGDEPEPLTVTTPAGAQLAIPALLEVAQHSLF